MCRSNESRPGLRGEVSCRWDGRGVVLLNCSPKLSNLTIFFAIEDVSSACPYLLLLRYGNPICDQATLFHSFQASHHKRRYYCRAHCSTSVKPRLRTKVETAQWRSDLNVQ